MTDNELAIERLKDIKTKVESIGDSVALDMAMSALKGEWIPVSERLPEKDMTCLVAVGLLNLTQLAMYSDLMGGNRPQNILSR